MLTVDLASTPSDSPEHDESNADQRTVSNGSRDTHASEQTARSEFEGEDEDFGRQEYEEWIGRKRKRTAPTGSKPPKKVTYAPQNAIVGKKKARGRPRKEQKKEHVYGLDSDEDDDERIEANQPEILKARREGFEDGRKKLGDAGLKLPPDYEDINFSDDERLDELEERPSLPKLQPCSEHKDIEMPLSGGTIPAPIAQWLREYQVKGAEFLHELFAYQKGGILGDDMGLGKTIQVIAFLTAAFGKTGDERDSKRMRKMRRHPSQPFYPKVLIVCPGTLMENWKEELERWGWWRIDVFHGSAAAKENALETAKNGRLEIMITTYTTYRTSRDKINLVEWDCVIADECHIVKEPTSEISIAMGETNAMCRIGLTGTAIQNNYENLWTLLNWTNPGRFGPLRSWKTAISEPLKVGQSHDATQQQLAKARSTAHKLVNNLLPRFFLRRMKTVIADQLPKKSDRVVFCPLASKQEEAYEYFLDSEKVTRIRDSTDDCDCGSHKKYGWCCGEYLSDGSRWQVHVFPCIAALQRLCSHLASLIPTSNEDPEIQSKTLENLQICCPEEWRELWRTRDSIINFTNREFCGKWRVLKKLLEFWHDAGDKVLIFSHSTRLLSMLQTLLQTGTSFTVSYLDGKMSYADRAEAVSTFNASPSQFCFLISTRAGGTGLNITSANKVVIVDPNWNPAHDLQAQDRAYRIGQQRDVEVFRLVSAGTIEEIVYARQVYKQQQANIGYTASHERRYFKGVMDKREQKGEIFGLKNLFTFHGAEGNVILRDIVNATNVAESKAGVSVAGVDMDSFAETEESQDFESARKRRKDDDFGPDDAMSQLADLIASGEHDKDPQDDNKTVNEEGNVKEEERKGNPISAILASAGVGYTHNNTDLLGSSRVEARLGRHAEEAAANGSASHPEALTKKVFASQSQSQSQPQQHMNGVAAERPVSRDYELGKKFRPPADVARRQFCSMAKALGWTTDEEGGVDVVGFAMAVEGWSGASRRAALERFYGMVEEGKMKGGVANGNRASGLGGVEGGGLDGWDSGEEEL